MKEDYQKKPLWEKDAKTPNTQTYMELKSKYKNSRRELKRLRTDNKFLKVMYKNEVKIRDFNEGEKELQNLYNRLLLEACPDIIFVLDTELKFLIGTKTAINSLGHERADEIEDKDFEKMLHKILDAEDADKYCERCNMCLKNKKPLFYSDRIKFKSGHTGYVHINITPAFDHIGELRGLVFVLHDITEITINEKKAESALKAKSIFLSNMSHEILTPINAVKGMANLLHMTDTDETQNVYIHNILRASDSLLSIINDVLDFSKINFDKFEINERPYRFSVFIEDIVNSVVLKAAEKNIEFVTDIDPSIPSELIGDSARIKQILINILNNGVKFTKEGFVKLLVKCRYIDEQNAELKFNVLDTGIGIGQEEVDRIFNAFSNLDMTNNRPAEGAGLGLAISKSLAERMLGTLEFESEPRMGSLFTFTLPQKVNSKTIIAAIENIEKKRVMIFGSGVNAETCADMLRNLFVEFYICESESKFLSHFEKHLFTHIIYWENQFGKEIERYRNRLSNIMLIEVKEFSKAGMDEQEDYNNITVLYEPVLITYLAHAINFTAMAYFETDDSYEDEIPGFQVRDVKALIVDDNEINLTVAGEMLKQYGVEAETALNGIKAIKMAEKKKYDLIFMDHMMPEMNGFESARRISQRCYLNKDTPVIAFTANAVTGIKDALAHMDDFIGKPIEFKELERVLRSWIPEEKILYNYKESELMRLLEKDINLLKALAEECNIDGYTALKNLNGNIKTYCIILKIFISTLPLSMDRIRCYFTKKDFERFKIEVHSMKTALANIGDWNLSEQSRKLEVAAKDNNVQYIYESYVEFEHNMIQLHEKLKLITANIFKKEKVGFSNGKGNIVEFKSHIEDIIKLIDELETDGALGMIEDLCQTDFSKGINKKLAEAKERIVSFDYDGGIYILSSILSGL